MKFALIICRKESRRLPGKNKMILGGKPLFQWSVDAALDSGQFDKIILSTDDPEILSLGATIEGLTLNIRPDELAADNVSSADVLRYIIQLELKKDNKPTHFCILHPTSPFRNVDQIRQAMEILDEKNADFVVGITEYLTPPHFALTRENGLHPHFEGCLTQVTRTQDVPTLYHPAGGLYAGRVKPFLKQGHFYGPGSIGFMLDIMSGWDINTKADFAFAQKLLPLVVN